MPALSSARCSPPCPLSLVELMSSALPSPVLANTAEGYACSKGSFCSHPSGCCCLMMLLALYYGQMEVHIRHQTRKRTAMVQPQSCNQEQILTQIKCSGHGLMEKLIFTVFLCAALCFTTLKSKNCGISFLSNSPILFPLCRRTCEKCW